MQWMNSRWILGLLVAGMTGPQGIAESQLVLFKNFQSFEKRTNSVSGTQDWFSPIIQARAPWEEAVVSWNLRGEGAVEVRATAAWVGHNSAEYIMGRWSNSGGVRESVDHQNDGDGKVLTDTLVAKRPAEGLRLHLILSPGKSAWPQLSLLGVSFWNHTNVNGMAQFSGPAAAVSVPIRSQALWPEGVQNWCSPTTTTMLLAYWGGELGRTNLVFDVPEVARQVNDPHWGGTGNWPFNMAFAGMQAGMRACVARLSGLDALASLARAGIPVGISVSYAELQGNPEPKKGDGHLIVFRGFDESGHVLVNDPGVRLERVSRAFPVADFLRAWDNSSRTVYLVWPESKVLPDGVGAEWRDFASGPSSQYGCRP